MKKKVSPRKSPQQSRSKERYQKILDTAFDLLSEFGYDALTTDLIAERSGISVGSIYQFFPNKEAIVYTHAETCYLNLHDHFFGLIREEMKTRKKFDSKLIDVTLNAFARTLEEVKGYHLVESILYTHPELLLLDQKSNERFANSLAKILFLPLFPNLSKERATHVALITVETVDSIFKSIYREPGRSKQKEKKIVDELKLFLLAYFEKLSKN
ncbi:TetR/AcrR family transcriptional regulator [Leptospira idonii]|uniref:TetR/AcrR family transcriptional regulator n=1 Tax=Leptospira idonii TaxID=1193500 RepID=A0A4R9LU86_9LEPT|nr:TetR/AcrR family transcriptional regulator [Leptospira idonii]TGN17302.1 TetR/AcrR family transcriptional regulator [Leptospira idonii]